MKNTLFPITEIFSSFQGEGPYQGTPASFIRFAGCNLKCAWCDTKYSWHPDKIEFNKMTIEQIIKLIQSFKNNHIVISGGEPLIYQKAILKIREVSQQSFIEVETNGSIALEIDPKTINQFNISPKLSNSGNKKYELKLNPENAIFKFVICNKKDINEIKEFTEKWGIKNEKVWLMPEGFTAKKLLEKEEEILKMAKKNNWNFTNRLHILKYGNKKGV